MLKYKDIVWTDEPDTSIYDKDELDKLRADSLIQWCKDLEDEQAAIHKLNLKYYQFYSNRFLASFDWGDNRFTRASLEPASATTDNVTIQIVDALLAEIGNSRPKAKPVLFGASWKKRNQAIKLDKFLYGEFIRTNAYEEAKSALLNAFICGFGAIRVDMDGSSKNAKICLTNIFPDDIIIDNTEYSATGKIYTIAWRRMLPARIVQATYGLTDEQIAVAKKTQYSLTYRKAAVDWIPLIEGIRISVDGLPGRRILAVPGCTIEDEEYKHDWLPYVFLHWSRPNKTFYPPSVVEQVLPNQLRLIDINAVIHRCQEIVSRPRLLVAQGSKVNPTEINNLNAKIIMYTGIKPEALKWDAVPVELYNERERELRIAFDKFGLNQSMAGGGLPEAARLDSAPAVREHNNIQSGRLSDPTQRYENFFLDIAKTIIRVIKASGSAPETTWFSGGKRSRAETIKWKEIDIEEDSYTLILEAASSFSMTPSAMRDSLEDQLIKGLITPEQYKRELGAPDLDMLNSIQSEALEDIHRVIELLEDGKYEHPIQEQDLINGTKLVQLRLLGLNRYEDDGDGELEQIKLGFIQWLVEARAILREGSEAQAPDQMVPQTTAPMVPNIQPNAASLVG